MLHKIKTKISSSAPALLTGASFLAGCYYVGLCVKHYLSQRPLWLDENMVFESVKIFSPGDFFTRRLADGQIFPKLYIFMIQRIAEPFALNLLSVRFLSFAAMLMAFLIWMKIARYEFKDRWLYLTYVLSWAGSSLLVYYSAELKPYSMDVLASAIMVLFLYNADKLLLKQPMRYFLSVALLPFLGLVSYTAVLYYVFIFYHLLTAKTKDAFWLRCILLFWATVVATLSCVYYFDIRLAKANTSSQGFSDHIVSLASAGEFFRTWWEGTLDLFGRFFAERPRIFKRVAVPFALIGFVYMFFAFLKNFRAGGYRFNTFRTMALVLYGELLLLGVLQKYPFSVPRTSLFFCPLVLFLIAEGIVSLKALNKNFSRVLHAAYMVFLLVIAWGIGREALSGNLGFAPLIL